MIVIPAIDIIEGQAVRLYKGDYSKKEIIGQKIMDIAKYFNEIGAGAIHMVDLDGAKEGHMVNGEIITKVARLVDVPVEAEKNGLLICVSMCMNLFIKIM